MNADLPEETRPGEHAPDRGPAPPREAGPPPWTVAGLADAVARALAHDYAGAASGRISDVPGVRVIRWYQTIGLVDKPAAMRGRTALYGPRHLRQIVAVKRLQAQGHTLDEIQERLLGAGDEVLAEVARLPEAAEPPPSPAAPGGGARRFWAQRPEEAHGEAAPSPEPPRTARPVPPAVDLAHVRTGPVPEAAVTLSDAGDAAAFGDHGAVPADLSYGVPLAPGVTVLYTGPRPPTAAEADALRAAAGPLLTAVSALREDRTRHHTDPAAHGPTEGASS